jgi:hypothetical protein
MTVVKKKAVAKKKPVVKKATAKTTKPDNKARKAVVVEVEATPQKPELSVVSEVEGGAESLVNQENKSTIDLSDALEIETAATTGEDKKEEAQTVDVELIGVNAVELGIGMAEGFIKAAAGEEWIPTAEEKTQLIKIIDSLMVKHGVGTSAVSPEAALVMFAASYAGARIIPKLLASVGGEDLDIGSDSEGGENGDK